jgi:uncharacterized protein with PIN domain
MSLKDDLMREVEKVIDKMVSERRGEKGLILSEIEEIVLSASRKIQEEMTVYLIRENEGRIEKLENCPECGGKPRHKGKREKTIITRTGEVKIKRTYWYCETCQQGFFSPGSGLGIDEQCL